MTRGAVRVAALAGRWRGTRRALCAVADARTAGRHSVCARALRCPGCTPRRAGLAFGASLAEGETSKQSAEYGASLAPPFPCGGVPDDGPARWDRRGERAPHVGAPEGRAEAGPEARAFARAGAAPGRRRPCRLYLQPYPACSERRQDAGGAGASPRSGCAARLRRPPMLSAPRGILHESIKASAGKRVRERMAYPAGQRSPQPDQGLPVRLPRHRRHAPGQLSQMVPSRRTRRPAIAQGVSRQRWQDHVYAPLIGPSDTYNRGILGLLRCIAPEVNAPAPAWDRPRLSGTSAIG